MRQREDGLQSNRLPVFRNGAVEIALPLKGGTDVDVRFRKSGIEADGLPILCNRSIQVAFGFQRKTDLIVRLGAARLQTESLPVFLYGAVKIILGHERIASRQVHGASIRCGWRRRNGQEERQGEYAQFQKGLHEGRHYGTHVAIIRRAGRRTTVSSRMVCCYGYLSILGPLGGPLV